LHPNDGLIVHARKTLRMAEGGAAEESLNKALKQKEALEETEKATKEQLDLREKQMKSITKVESDIDDLLAFAKKSMSKKLADTD